MIIIIEFCTEYILLRQSVADILEVGKFMPVFIHSFIYTFIKYLLTTNYGLSPKMTGMKDWSFFP